MFLLRPRVLVALLLISLSLPLFAQDKPQLPPPPPANPKLSNTRTGSCRRRCGTSSSIRSWPSIGPRD